MNFSALMPLPQPELAAIPPGKKLCRETKHDGSHNKMISLVDLKSYGLYVPDERSQDHRSTMCCFLVPQRIERDGTKTVFSDGKKPGERRSSRSREGQGKTDQNKEGLQYSDLASNYVIRSWTPVIAHITEKPTLLSITETFLFILF